jgi:tetratricopeptide (TPR) repeat protein
MKRILTKKQSDYLLELSCIPVELRQRLLNKFYFRKNGTEQKNYKFLLIMDRIIKKDNFNKWDEEKICKELKVSKAMLACMKSRILRSLREEYFNLKTNNKKEKLSVDKTLELIKGLEEKGCYREVIPVCFKLIKRISGELKEIQNVKVKAEQIEKISELYYIISQFYFYNKNLKRFKKIYSFLEKIKKKSNKFSNTKIVNNINARYYLVKSQLFLFKQGNNKYLQLSLQYKLKSLISSERAKDYLLVIRNLIHLARIYRLLGEYDNAVKIIKKGQRFQKLLRMKICFPCLKF